jgi:hypothetical protein
MDRFSEQSPADLQRAFSSRLDRDEDGYFEIDADFTEPVEVATPEQPVCLKGRWIIETAQTVGELLDGFQAHKLVCGMCRGEAIPIRKAVTDGGKAAA